LATVGAGDRLFRRRVKNKELVRRLPAQLIQFVSRFVQTPREGAPDGRAIRKLFENVVFQIHSNPRDRCSRRLGARKRGALLGPDRIMVIVFESVGHPTDRSPMAGANAAGNYRRSISAFVLGATMRTSLPPSRNRSTSRSSVFTTSSSIFFPLPAF
jgi:hypothetical protein